jgi:hypothetical protein
MHRLAFASLLAVLPGCPASTTADAGTDTPVLDVSSLDVPELDAPVVSDAPLDTPVPVDTAGNDAGPACEGGTFGSCEGGLSCGCCPAGGPTMNCLCSTPCTTDADCTDAARPTCQHPPDGPGFCAPAAFTCCWLCL